MSVELLRCTPISCLPMVRFLRGERTPYWAGATRVTHEMVAANHAANMSPPYGMEDSFNSIQNWHPSNLGFYRGVNCAADLSKKYIKKFTATTPYTRPTTDNLLLQSNLAKALGCVFSNFWPYCFVGQLNSPGNLLRFPDAFASSDSYLLPIYLLQRPALTAVGGYWPH